MAYTWTTGEVITADKLNNTGGVFLVTATATEGSEVSLDKPYNEILAALEAGQVLLMHVYSNNALVAMFPCNGYNPSNGRIGFANTTASSVVGVQTKGVYIDSATPNVGTHFQDNIYPSTGST